MVSPPGMGLSKVLQFIQAVFQVNKNLARKNKKKSTFFHSILKPSNTFSWPIDLDHNYFKADSQEVFAGGGQHEAAPGWFLPWLRHSLPALPSTHPEVYFYTNGNWGSARFSDLRILSSVLVPEILTDGDGRGTMGGITTAKWSQVRREYGSLTLLVQLGEPPPLPAPPPHLCQDLQQQPRTSVKSHGGYQQSGFRLHSQQRRSLHANSQEVGGHQYPVREW